MVDINVKHSAEYQICEWVWKWFKRDMFSVYIGTEIKWLHRFYDAVYSKKKCLLLWRTHHQAFIKFGMENVITLVGNDDREWPIRKTAWKFTLLPDWI